MSRPVLSLFALDRAALKVFSAELRSALTADDRSALAKILELSPAMATRFDGLPRAVDLLLRPEQDPAALPVFASLRRIAKRRALTLAWTSEEPSLEGRLRQYDVLREELPLAKNIDRLLDSNGLPWFLCRRGATAGWLDDKRREALAAGMVELRAALPKELVAFAEALDEVSGDVLAHDGI